MDYPMDSPNASSSSSFTSSSSSGSIHPASLVDASSHSPALLQIVESKISKSAIDYLVDCVSDTVDFAMGRPSPPQNRGRATRRRNEHPKFTAFVTNVLSRAEVTMPVVLTSLVYIDRARPHLHIALEEWAMERVFLGSLILASKYLNDSTLKNVHWAICTGVFGKRDIGRIEREFLDVLDFELSVTEDQLLSHQAGLAAVALPTPSPSPRHSPITRPTSSQRRSHHRVSVPVPALEPSSPSSSDGTSSPQTPSTLHESPESIPRVKPLHSKHHASFHDLIRAFPLPLPHRHHSHNRYPAVRVQA